ncbi:MAG: hypothetical protein P8Z76_04745 [Alphaproteobacteria bacterium]
MSTTSPTPFLFGTVIGRGFSLLFRNTVAFGTIAVVLMLPYAAVAALQALGYLPTRSVGTVILELVVGFALPQLMMAAIVYGSFQDMRGQKISVGDAIAGGFQVIMPVVGTGIVTGIATLIAALPMLMMTQVPLGGLQILLALALLAAPIYLLVLFFVAIPACVVEKMSVGDAIRRSVRLTADLRWRVLAILAIVWAVGVGVLLVLGALALAVSLTGSVLGAPVLISLAMAFYYALSAAMATVAYHDMRVAKEGIGSDMVARVFD